MSVPYVGAKISLISKSRIRYEGILFTIDADKSQVTLRNVRSFGTEDRRPESPIGPSTEVWECIIFRGSDIQDLHVCEPPPAAPQPVPSQDPAIVGMPPMPPGGFPGYGVPPNFSGYYGGYPYNPYGGFPGYGPYQATGPLGGQPPAGQPPAAGAAGRPGVPTTTPASTAPTKTAEATVPALGVYPSTQQQGVSPLAQLSQTPVAATSPASPAPATAPATAAATAAPAPTPQVAAPTTPPASAPTSVTSSSSSAAAARTTTAATLTPKTPAATTTGSTTTTAPTTTQGPKPAPTAGTRPASFAPAGGRSDRDRRAFPATASAGPGARDILQPFDFDASNALWDKEKDSVQPAEPVEQARPAYVKSSFFDSISCETTDRAANPGARAPSLYEQRVLDSETFGSTAVQDRERTQRRGGRGGRGGRGRGRGSRPSNGYTPREHSAARGPTDT